MHHQHELMNTSLTLASFSTALLSELDDDDDSADPSVLHLGAYTL
jgi:hypothetical protein